MIVGDGAERASVLRPHCLPSGGRRRQRPLKWPSHRKPQYDKDDKDERIVREDGGDPSGEGSSSCCRGVRVLALTAKVFPVRSDLPGLNLVTQTGSAGWVSLSVLFGDLLLQDQLL